MDQGNVSSKKITENTFYLNRFNISFWNKNISMGETMMWPKHDKSNAELRDRLCKETNNEASSSSICDSYGCCLNNFAKTEICKYYKAPGGCVRGHNCLYAHGDGELRPTKIFSGASTKNFDRSVSENLNRKIFIGGLPPSVDSDDLREFFENKFGQVEEAIVMEGEHGHSRGFGFVVFKHEKSVASALQAHHVAIFGKKVEIKSAVPKGMLSLPDQTLPNERVSEESDEKKEEILMSWADMVIAGHLKSKQTELKAPVIGPTSEIPWVETFKKWLPGFLREVSKRLREGELYPLSSLKGDFRATCGLELDHASLGYLKLSDFMRALPGICRMKIVPVGRGPATHMVLLEQPSRAHRPQLQGHNQHPQPIPVGPPRSYADAACKAIMPSERSPTPSNKLVSNGQLIQAQQALEELKYSSSLFAASYGDVSGAGPSSWKMPHSKESSISTNVDIDPKFLIFLQRDRSFFTPWEPALEESEISAESKSESQEEGSLEEAARKMGYMYQSQEKSPEITIPAFCGYPSSDSLWGAQASMDSSSGKGRIGSHNMCVFCKEKMARWASVPCGHRVLCSACKNKLSGDGKPAGQCLVCQVQVRTFIALFE